MDDKTIDIPELSTKIFNLLNYLEQNCIRLIEVNHKISSVDVKNQDAINKNINSIELVFNRILAIREELEVNMKEQLINIQDKEFTENNYAIIMRSSKVLKIITAEILNNTYYVNPNGKIIK